MDRRTATKWASTWLTPTATLYSGPLYVASLYYLLILVQEEVFADASRSFPNTNVGSVGTTAKGGLFQYCRGTGDTVSLFFPAGTKVGFYLHRDGTASIPPEII